jgi:hypothetical protein
MKAFGNVFTITNSPSRGATRSTIWPISSRTSYGEPSPASCGHELEREAHGDSVDAGIAKRQMTGVGLDKGQWDAPVLSRETSARRLDHPQRQIDSYKGALGTDLPGQRGQRVPATNADLQDLLARSSGKQSQPGSAGVVLEWRFDPVVPRCEPVIGRPRLAQRAFDGSHPGRP